MTLPGEHLIFNFSKASTFHQQLLHIAVCSPGTACTSRTLQDVAAVAVLGTRAIPGPASCCCCVLSAVFPSVCYFGEHECPEPGGLSAGGVVVGWVGVHGASRAQLCTFPLFPKPCVLAMVPTCSLAGSVHVLSASCSPAGLAVGLGFGALAEVAKKSLRPEDPTGECPWPGGAWEASPDSLQQCPAPLTLDPRPCWAGRLFLQAIYPFQRVWGSQARLPWPPCTPEVPQ